MGVRWLAVAAAPRRGEMARWPSALSLLLKVHPTTWSPAPS